MSYRKDSLITILILLLILIVVAIYTYSLLNKRDQEQVAPSAVEEVFLVEEGEDPWLDIAGNELAVDSYKGEILIVNSWASWSPASANELTLLSKIASEYKDANINIMAINRAETAKRARLFLNTIPSHENITLVQDPNDKFFKSIGGHTMPETIFYDDAGNIVHHSKRELSEAEIRLHINKALRLRSEQI